MKIILPAFDTHLEFIDNYINVIQVENPTLLTNFISSIHMLTLKESPPEKILLVEDDDFLDFSKSCTLLTDLFNIEFNSKKLITKICSKINTFYLDQYELKVELETLIHKMSLNLKTILLNFDFEVSASDNIEISDLIKFLQVKIDLISGSPLLDTLLLFIDINSEFQVSNLLIFVNLKKYFSEDDLITIYKHAINKQICILTFEQGCPQNLLKYEQRLFIDNNFNERLDLYHFL